MMLYVMRHGLAEDAGPEEDDRARKLTPRGREKIRLAAAGMRAMGLSFDAILTSSFPRAAETAALVAAEIDDAPAPEPVRELEPGTAPGEMLSAIIRLAAHDSVMVVGHEPGLSRLASTMLTGSPEGAAIRLKQGGVVALEFPDHVERKGAVLRWMMTQKQLRKR